jgi:hypothetical protein
VVYYQGLAHDESAGVLGLSVWTLRRTNEPLWSAPTAGSTSRPTCAVKGRPPMSAERPEDRLLDLWDELRARGREPTPEELCADAPELLSAIVAHPLGLPTRADFAGS